MCLFIICDVTTDYFLQSIVRSTAVSTDTLKVYLVHLITQGEPSRRFPVEAEKLAVDMGHGAMAPFCSKSPSFPLFLV